MSITWRKKIWIWVELIKVLDGWVFGKANSYLQNTKKPHVISTNKFPRPSSISKNILWLFLKTFSRNFAFKTDKILTTRLVVFRTSLTFDQIQEWGRRGGTYFLYYVTVFTSRAAFFLRFRLNKMADSRPSLSHEGHNGVAHILKCIILNYSIHSPWKYCIFLLSNRC